MTIPFTGTGGLFTRIGQIGQVVADIQALVATTLPADVTALLAQYQGEPDLIASVPTQANASKLAITGFDSTLQQVAAQTVERMVFRDNPISTRSNPLTNVQEVIRQMLVSGDTVKRCTVAATVSVLPGYTNVGTGAVVLSVKRGDGLTQENSFAETARLVCTGDAQQGGVAGSETFQFQGTEAQTNPFHYEWPLGSGASASITSTDATKNNSSGNLLTNSAFTTQTSNLAANWVDQFSQAGISFFTETTQVFGSDTKAVRFSGGTGQTPAITQQFNLSTGTAGALKPSTVYHFNVWMKVNNVPGSGSIVFELVDGNNNAIADDSGTANQYTVQLNTVTQSYGSYSVAFRTPKTLPTTARLRYRIGNSIPAGGFQLYLAHTALAVANSLYVGGPNASVFSGATNWIKADTFLVTVTNDRGGSTNQKTFQSLFDRLFSMRLNNLLLPSAASPTILDSLI